jgi:hypothetical protein
VAVAVKGTAVHQVQAVQAVVVQVATQVRVQQAHSTQAVVAVAVPMVAQAVADLSM